MLCLDIFVCDLQPSLKAAQLRILATHVPQENYEHISTILLGGDCIGASCLDTATGSTENIQLPGRGKAALETVELDRNDLRRSLGPWCNHSLSIASRRGGRPAGRKVSCPCDAPWRARL